jgi:hypothetical protein
MTKIASMTPPIPRGTVIRKRELWNRTPATSSQRCGRSMLENQTKGLDKVPQCVKCDTKMRFSCTEPDKPGFVHHVYECTNCRSTQSFVTPV